MPKHQIRLIWWMSIGISVCVVIGLLTQISMTRMVASAQERRDAYEGVLKLEVTQRFLTDAETSQRGYLLTQDNKYLDPYKKSWFALQQYVVYLEHMPQFSPPKLHTLKQLIMDKFVEMNRTIRLTKEGNRQEAVRTMAEGQGQRLMDRIRVELDRLRDVETAKVNSSTASAKKFATTMLVLFPLAGGCSLALVFASAWAVNRTALRAEDAEEQMHTLIDSVPDYAIFRLTPDGHIASWNPGAQRIKGYDASEILGKHYCAFFTPEDREAGVPEHRLEVAARDGWVSDEGWRVRKDGTRFWATTTLSAIRGQAGELCGFSKVTRDMTEQRTAESALRESEARLRESEVYLRTVVSLAPNAVLVTNADGFIKEWNRAAERTFGYTQEEVVGKHAGIIIPERFHNEYVAMVRRAGQDGRPVLARHSLELVGVRKGGEEFPMELTFDVAEMGGELLRFAILRDVTEQQHAVREMRRLNQHLQRVNAELSRSNAELDQFASVASHDLQSPLRQVVSYVQLLERRYGDKLDDSGKQFVKYVVEGAARMQDLIKDLLTFARAGGEFRPVPVDMDRVVEIAIRNLGSYLADHHAEVDRPGNMPKVLGDEGQLAQVFQNLISNAVKFCAEGTKPLVKIAVAPHGIGWEFSVSDNGIGMQKDHLDQIFIMFKRLHGNEYPGTGIGLSICKKVIERHGGSIRVESEPGVGSTFYVALPAAANSG